MRIPALVLFLLASLLVPSVYAQSTHEQILVPFDSAIFETASGRWLAELWVRNDGAQPVNLFPEQCSFIGLISPCQRRIDIPAGQTVRIDLRPDDPRQPGLFFYLPAGRGGDVSFNLRIRDVNQGMEQIGTEIPIVREADFKSGKATLLNVPLQTNGRVHLRIYQTELVSATFRVRMYAEPSGGLISERTYQLQHPTDPPSPVVAPLMIDASESFRNWIADRVRVTVEGTTPFWPLLTITNTRNNQITTVTPQ